MRKIKVVVVLAVLAAVFCVLFFGRDKGEAQSVLIEGKNIPIPKECDSLYPKRERGYDPYGYSKDSTALMECYTKYTGNKEIKCKESEFNEYSVCAVIYPKIFGFPRECLNFAKQKDSLSYTNCCKRNNACWMFVYDNEKSESIPEQLPYKWLNPNEFYSIEDVKEDPEIPIRKMKESRKRLMAKMDSICNEEKNADMCKKYEEARNKLRQN